MGRDAGTLAGIEPPRQHDARGAALVCALGARSIVLIGMMGSGKTSTGRRLAQRLSLPFVDADAEIEAAAGMSIAEIFSTFGEAYFRDGERRVMARLLAAGPRVVATGGGAFMNEATRARIAAEGISVWLKADLDVLLRRVRRRTHRPLLQTADPAATLQALMDAREPAYREADLTVISHDGPFDVAVEDTMTALEFFLRYSPRLNAPRGAPPLPGASSDADEAAGVERVEVALGAQAYDIHIGFGLLGAAGARVRRFAPRAACAVVTDETVARLHLPSLTAALDSAGVSVVPVVVPPGEGSKSYATFERVCDAIIAARLERRDPVVALGGGVVGDLAGFAAASVRRGMPLIQIPTTLLAQVDSSVGGKTGLNSRYGKNLVGAFHQPAVVLIDPDVLSTLPRREFAAGYAEMVKYGLIGDADFFGWLERQWRDVFAGGPARTRAIAKSCAAKAAVVVRDETEQGDRALLNLGHTFGHALERLTDYDGARLVHGEAVAIGMACAYRFSVRQELCPPAEARRVESHLREVGLPTRIGDIAGWDAGPRDILEAMLQDKKVEGGALTLILARGAGTCFIAKSVDPTDVAAFLEDELQAGP